MTFLRPLCLLAAIVAIAPAPAMAQSAPTDPQAVPPAAAARPPRILAGEPSCQPEYPAAALRAGVTGTTGVRLWVSAAGQVVQAEIRRSAGPTREHRLLDNAARQAFISCPVVPGLDSAGHPAGGQVDLTFTWRH